MAIGYFYIRPGTVRTILGRRCGAQAYVGLRRRIIRVDAEDPRELSDIGTRWLVLSEAIRREGPSFSKHRPVPIIGEERRFVRKIPTCLGRIIEAISKGGK